MPSYIIETPSREFIMDFHDDLTARRFAEANAPVKLVRRFPGTVIWRFVPEWFAKDVAAYGKRGRRRRKAA